MDGYIAMQGSAVYLTNQLLGYIKQNNNRVAESYTEKTIFEKLL